MFFLDFEFRNGHIPYNGTGIQEDLDRTTSYPIFYHNGPVLTTPSNNYKIN
jgi:hypothetical protein